MSRARRPRRTVTIPFWLYVLLIAVTLAVDILLVVIAYLYKFETPYPPYLR